MEENLKYEVYSYENGIATIAARCRRMYDATQVLNAQIDGGFIMDEFGNELARTGTAPVETVAPEEVIITDETPVEVPEGEH